MPIPTDRATWAHSDPTAASDHIADHNALAASVNALEQGGGGGNDPRLYAFAITTAAQMTGTTIQDVTGMVFPVAASGIYFFTFVIDVTLSQGTGASVAWGLTIPASPTRFMAKRSQMTSGTAVAVSLLTAAGSFPTGTGTVAKTLIEGTLWNGSNAGNIQLRATLSGTSPQINVGGGSGGWMIKAN